jgi:hypothetical protein
VLGAASTLKLLRGSQLQLKQKHVPLLMYYLYVLEQLLFGQRRLRKQLSIRWSLITIRIELCTSILLILFTRRRDNGRKFFGQLRLSLRSEMDRAIGKFVRRHGIP